LEQSVGFQRAVVEHAHTGNLRRRATCQGLRYADTALMMARLCSDFAPTRATSRSQRSGWTPVRCSAPPCRPPSVGSGAGGRKRSRRCGIHDRGGGQRNQEWTTSSRVRITDFPCGGLMASRVMRIKEQTGGVCGRSSPAAPGVECDASHIIRPSNRWRPPARGAINRRKRPSGTVASCWASRICRRCRGGSRGQAIARAGLDRRLRWRSASGRALSPC